MQPGATPVGQDQGPPQLYDPQPCVRLLGGIALDARLIALTALELSQQMVLFKGG
jgi:hypothetical protein